MQPWTTCINVDQSLGNALARVSRFTSSIAVDLPSPRVLEHSYRQFMEKPPASQLQCRFCQIKTLSVCFLDNT